MTFDPFLVGIGSAALALILTVFIPVSAHKVNQTLIAAVIAVLIFVAAFSVFDPPLAVGVGIVGSGAAILIRAIVRSLRKFLWHNFFRYTRRQYWQTKIGQAVTGGDRRRRPRRRANSDR